MLAAYRPQGRGFDVEDVVTVFDYVLWSRRDYTALYDQVCEFGPRVKEEEMIENLGLSTI